MIKAALITTYLYVLIPLLIGAAITIFIKQKINISFAYVLGYMVFLSVFEITILVEAKRSVTYLQFVKIYWIASNVITALSLATLIIYIFKKRITNKKTLSLEHSFIHGYENYSIIVLTISLIVLSVIFLVPHSQDQTPELARSSLASNAFFSINPTTGKPFQNSSDYPGYLFLLFASGSTLTGIDVTVLIHLVIPVFFIPLFVCCYIIIANNLFPGKTHDRDRFHFVCLVILFYLLMLPLETHLAFVPYRNIWNGITLATSCLLPLFVSVCLAFIRNIGNRISEKEDELTITETIVYLVCIALSLQLCLPYGYILCALFILSSAVILIMKPLSQRCTRKKEVKNHDD